LSRKSGISSLLLFLWKRAGQGGATGWRVLRGWGAVEKVRNGEFTETFSSADTRKLTAARFSHLAVGPRDSSKKNLLALNSKWKQKDLCYPRMARFDDELSSRYGGMCPAGRPGGPAGCRGLRGSRGCTSRRWPREPGPWLFTTPFHT
ncbi:hypothetical protein FQN60_003401, partial [Etheostoma spectabile]